MATSDNNNGSEKPEDKNFCIEKIICYEMKNFLYVIGSSSCKTKHRILKIDRTKKYELEIDSKDRDRVFTTGELNSYRRNEGFDKHKEPTVAFGIVGFVRFLEGYYLILIVKRRCIAIIGTHCIYKIEDTNMIYVPNEEKSSTSDEQRFLRIFNNVDLKSNFYFSYSYDLSNTLQFNLLPNSKGNSETNFCFGFGTDRTIWDVSEEFRQNRKYESINDRSIYIKPNMKFVWNEFLLKPMIGKKIHNDFFLYICHGFVNQALLPIDGRNLILTIIARRSKKYAGTRYLKRGANCDGDTANEVETEQIVHDGNISSFRYGLFSSFVQLRGSVPIHWSQNITKMTPKPQIIIDINDPFYETAGKHFNNLLFNYGSPIIVMNLVKRKEKRPQESILYKELESAIEYLNQFLPKKHQIMLIGYDMARCKKQGENVIDSLLNLGHYTLNKTGFYQNRLTAQNITDHYRSLPQFDPETGSIIQTGIVRMNCVDCLDRTNTAQCVVGIAALAHQLYAMGVLYKPELEFETDIVRLLEELYEDHGDTLALQYGGSQLVHRIKTYRKGAPITSQSKDIMQSLSRYYSNAFSDWDKQTAINLFLGIYETKKFKNLNLLPQIWTMNSDYELHHNFFNNEERKLFENFNESDWLLPSSIQGHNRNRYTKWWSDRVALCLPRSGKEFFKFTKDGMSKKEYEFVKIINNYDWFFDVHRLQENTNFNETFLFNMKKSKYFFDDFNNGKNINFNNYGKKLSTYRIQNRQTFVGIPITIGKVSTSSNSTGQDDSDTTDDSDDENDKIIIRFENDPYAFDLDHVEDAAGISFNNNNQKESPSSMSSMENSLVIDQSTKIDSTINLVDNYRKYVEILEKQAPPPFPDSNDTSGKLDFYRNYLLQNDDDDQQTEFRSTAQYDQLIEQMLNIF